jgi:hypothetical protein
VVLVFLATMGGEYAKSEQETEREDTDGRQSIPRLIVRIDGMLCLGVYRLGIGRH